MRRQLQLKIKRELVLQPAEISVSSIDREFIKELQEIIEKNLSDSEFNEEQMGKKLYMSRASLYRLAPPFSIKRRIDYDGKIYRIKKKECPG